jgi:DNA-binding NtrC family response regulator
MTDSTLPTTAVLIVENDCLLRMLTTDLVEGAGFLALQAANADEALALLSARSDIAVLLTGVAMSGNMDGMGLAHVAHERWPHLKVIVASGRASLSLADLPADCRTLRKPYRAASMISTINGLIGAGASSPASERRVYLDI